MTAAAATAERPRRFVVYWCLYDLASSAFPAIILSFVFAPYFLERVAVDPVQGQAQWGFAISASAIVIAVLSPVFGAFADRGGRRREWLGGCSLVAIVATFAMWWVVPGPSSLVLALTLLVLANAGFELGYVFYNAMLAAVAPPHTTGRVSGLGWATGYLGSLASLGVVYVVLFLPDAPPFGLDPALSEPVRLAAPLTALWFLVFALPLVFRGPPEAGSRQPPLRVATDGIRDLWQTLKALPRMPAVAWFLVANIFYIDGVNTLFIFGPLVAKGVFGFSEIEMLLFGVTIYVAAGAGAVVFGWIDDRIGAKRVVVASVVALAAITVVIAFVESATLFWIAAACLGIFFGPVQASSRSLMSRLAPEAMRTKLFGLYALAGRATGPLGVALVGWATLASGSQKIGIVVVVASLLIGLALLTRVRDPAP